VVIKCDISRYPLAGGVVDATMSSQTFENGEYVSALNGIVEAFKALRRSGFYSSRFTILEQDPNRHDVALTFLISGPLLEAVLRKAKLLTSTSEVADFDIAQAIAISEPNEQSGIVQEQLLSELEIMSITGT
jgi:hypothetical protein